MSEEDWQTVPVGKAKRGLPTPKQTPRQARMREQAKEAALALQGPATDGSGETTAAAVTSWAALLEPTGLFDAVLRAVKSAVSEEGIAELVVLGFLVTVLVSACVPWLPFWSA